MQDAWEAFGNGQLPHINPLGKNLGEIAGRWGYLDENALADLARNVGGIAKPKNNRITFSVRGLTFEQNGESSRREIHDGDKQVIIPSGHRCAEHTLYRGILGDIEPGENLVISQSKAPCSGCLNKLQGLARTNRINIYVRYDEAYDLLNKPNGQVFISITGKISWNV